MTTTDPDEAWASTDAPPSIYVLMGKVLADLPAIGKNQRNSEQGFMFRGYDDVLNGLNPILSRYGVFFVPDVIERIAEKRATRSGGTMYEVNLHVRFTFYGPRGDSVTATGWGEGTDMGDKATNKAMTNALKYVLFQTFAISTQEAAETDADRHSPEGTVPDEMECRLGCGKMIPGARTDREPMRVHAIEEHGWVRQTDGTVMSAEDNAARIAAADAESAALGEGSQDTPSTSGDNAGDNPPPADEAQQAPTKAAPKKRASKATAPAAPTAPDPAPPADDPAPPDDAPSDPPVAEDDAAPAVTDTDPDPDGGQDDEGFQCPDCEEPPFATQDEYTAHWYAAHDIDAPADQGVDVTPDDLATTVATVKTRISALTGGDARAYGAYRREHSLPRPDDLNAEQAAGLLSFLDELAAATK